MRVLITGVAGFIGSHIADGLLAKGYEVVGVDDMRTGRVENLPDTHPNFRFHRLDILNGLHQIQDVTHVCHQAASGSVPRSIDFPGDTTQNNVIGFDEVCAFARDRGIKRVVFASSSSVYGNGRMVCQSPYAMTKRINEMQAQQFQMHYKMECLGLRYFNVFGPRQRADGIYAAVIPKWIDAIYHDEPIEINGDGLQTRDFTYVSNIVEANIKALEFKAVDGMVGNMDVGCGEPMALETLACFIGERLGKAVQISHRPDKSRGVISSCASKINQIGFKTSVGLQEGLEKTIAHYLAAR